MDTFPEELLVIILRESAVAPRTINPAALLVCRRWRLAMIEDRQNKLLERLKEEVNQLTTMDRVSYFERLYRSVCSSDTRKFVKYSVIPECLVLRIFNNKRAEVSKVEFVVQINNAIFCTTLDESERRILTDLSKRLVISRAEDRELDMYTYSTVTKNNIWFYREKAHTRISSIHHWVHLKVCGKYSYEEPGHYRQLLHEIGIEYIHHLVLARFIELI